MVVYIHSSLSKAVSTQNFGFWTSEWEPYSSLAFIPGIWMRPSSSADGQLMDTHTLLSRIPLTVLLTTQMKSPSDRACRKTQDTFKCSIFIVPRWLMPCRPMGPLLCSRNLHREQMKISNWNFHSACLNSTWKPRTNQITAPEYNNILETNKQASTQTHKQIREWPDLIGKV